MIEHNQSDEHPGAVDSAEFADPQSVLASIMASSADAIIGQRLDGVITIWNAGAEQIYGWSAAEMLGTSVRRIIPQDLHQEIEFLLSRVRQGERVRELLTRRVRSDGCVLDISLTVSPIRDSHGQVSGICTIERDVTRRRRVEAIVQGQQRMLETLTRTGRLADGLRELLDAVEGLAAGDICPAVMIADDERRVLTPSVSRLPARLMQALRKGVPIAPGGHPAGAAVFTRQAVSTPDLSDAPGFDVLREAALASGFHSCCSIPILSPGGNVRGTLDLYGETPGDPRADDLEVATALAQTAALAIDRFETVRELHQGREVLLALNGINSLLVAELDAESIIRRGTEEATRLLGAQLGAYLDNASDADGTGSPLRGVAGEFADQFAGLSFPRSAPLINQTLTVGAVQRLSDVTADPRYGRSSFSGVPEKHPVLRSFMSAPVRSGSGDTLGMLLFGHELPGRFTRWHEEILRGIASQTALALENARLFLQARERAAELAQADRRKDEFLAMIGHELRGPLSAMTVSLTLLEQTSSVSEPGRESMQILRRQAAHMRRLVDDLLEVSRITRGKILLRRQVMDARDGVMQTVESVRSEVPERGQAIRVDLPSTPIWIDADPVRFEQIVANLLLNALKFSPPRALIRVSITGGEDDVRIVVHDEGAGIPADKIDDIFEMFVQGDDDQRRAEYGGLGLGLTLVRELVHLHGGTVTARSEGQGQGSAFEIMLPAAEAPLGGLPDVPKLPSEVQVVPVLRLLLVEDDVDAARALSLLLRHWGHKVQHVQEGAVAVETARKMRPDAALLDIGLPGMDGWETARRMRAEPGLEHMRLVALTGRSQSIDTKRSKEAGFDQHFVKPADPKLLGAWLEDVAAAILV